MTGTARMNSPTRIDDLKRLVDLLEEGEAKAFAAEIHQTGASQFYFEVPQGKRDLFRWLPILPNGQESSFIEAARAPIFLRVNAHHMKSLLDGKQVSISSFSGVGLFIDPSTKDGPRSKETLTPEEGRLIQAGTSISRLEVVSGARVTPRYSVISMQLEDLLVLWDDATLMELKRSGSRPELLNEIAASQRATKKAAEVVPDPYDLKTSSPLVFAILKLAFRNRNAEDPDSIPERSSSALKALNSRYKKNPKPFSDKRRTLAVKLTDPHYVYVGTDARPPLAAKRSVPDEPFLRMKGLNQMLQKLLYAACCWSNKIDEGISGNEKKLVTFLASLGLYDNHMEDQVQSFAFFITGRSLERDWKKNPLRRHEAM